MKIKEIFEGEYDVFRRPGKLCMTVREYPHSKRLERADTGLLGDKYVPADVEKAIRRHQQSQTVTDRDSTLEILGRFGPEA